MSKSALQKYSVSICGDVYPLVSDDGTEFVSSLAHQVESLMQSVAQESGLSDQKKIAVLAAMQMSYTLRKLSDELEHSRAEYLRLAHMIDQGLQLPHA